MSIQEQVKSDMIKSFKAGNKDVCSNLKYILGEFSRLKGTKTGKEYVSDILSDEKAIKVIKSIMTEEFKLNGILNRETSDFLVLLSSYLPEKVDKEEIIVWIKNNVDFSTLKNKMQAVGIIKKHFGVTVDGKLVSDIIKNWR